MTCQKCRYVLRGDKQGRCIFFRRFVPTINAISHGIDMQHDRQDIDKMHWRFSQNRLLQNLRLRAQFTGSEIAQQFVMRHVLAAILPVDRKSVVEGKSVSVRVDLVDRSIIKKKKMKTNEIENSRKSKQQ